MKRLYRRLVTRWGKKTVVLGAVGVIAVLALGGGAYAAWGGSGRAQSANDIELQRGLVGRWKLDGNTKDATPYAHDGTISGGLSTASDRKGATNKAYAFPSTSGTNNISFGDQAVFDAPEVTLSAWIYPTDLSFSPVIMGKAQQYTITVNYLGGISVLADNDGTSPSAYNGGVGPGSGVITENSWQLITVTISSSQKKITAYVNGTQVGSATWNYSMTTYNNNPLLAGSSASSSRFIGSMDDVRMYNRAISADEAKALYDQYDPGVAAASGESGLVGWWKMDGNAKDSTPYANDGTVTGSTLTTDRKGRANSAYSFNGTSNYISTGVGGLPYPADSHTVSAWIYPTSSNGVVTELTNQSTGGDAGLKLVSGNLKVIGNGGLLKVGSATVVTLNQWHHVAYSYAGNGTGGTSFPYCLYLDGQQLACNNAISDGSDGGALLFTIGAYFDQSNFFTGKIDDVRIYKRVLSPAEIMAQYNSYDSQINLGANPTNTQVSGNINAGLVGYWPFSGNAKDATPQGNNGTVNGATLTTDRFGRANSAYSFNGSTDHIDLPNVASYDASPGQAITLSIWMKAPPQPQTTFPLWRSDFCIGWYLKLTTDGNLQLEEDTGNSGCTGTLYAAALTSDKRYDDNAWHLVTGTIDRASGIMKLYVDGQFKASSTVDTTTSGAGGNTRIGTNWNDTQQFEGALDDFRIYNRALSTTEIQALYDSRN